jgi:predicted nucleotidyltransferase
MKYGLEDIEVEKLCDVFAQHIHVQRAVLYGSRAKNTFKPFSDIDITLIGKDLTRDDLIQISSAIDDLLLPYNTDLSLFAQLNNDALIDHIHRVGITIYEKPV